jgi:hypothetical protein
MPVLKKLFFLCLLLVQLVGCRGCQQSQKPAPTADDAEKKKKLQRLSLTELKAMPFSSDTGDTVVEPNLVKPGHWYQANSKIKANYEDESLEAQLTVLNREGKQAPISPGQPHVEFSRTLTLSKGQEKNIRLRFFQPEVGVTGEPADDNNQIPSQLVATLSQRSLGTTILEKSFSNKLLSGYQYNLVSISRDPSRYTFWRKLDCIIWPSKLRFSNERISPHRIIDLKEDEVANQFPDRFHAMTSISHLVINDASLSIMSEDQTNAVQDWLRFGGTIIVNGPESIGGIESSFLKTLVPITNTSNAVVSKEEIESINRHWTIQQALGAKTPFSSVKPIPKLDGALGEGATWVNFVGADGQLQSLDGLVAERMVGQGRIVMTSFPMTDIAFLNWPSYSSFIHNVILRKPPRTVTTGFDADTKYAGEMESTELNPIHSTRMRIWARDLDSTMIRSKPSENQKSSRSRSTNNRVEGTSNRTSTLQTEDFKPTKRSSLAAWNPESLILKNARIALQESSGITVPKLNTILKLLAGYLVVLVPVNWIVFRLMRRVELAWVAAPIIATVGAFIVARSVQLDVGFSRSQTTYGFLECHTDHSRGVLSKYTAMYTSLSTNYQAMYEQDNGIVLPLASATTSNRRRSIGALSKIEYAYSGDSGSGLRNISVLSNTTGLLQSEEMLDLRGAVSAQFGSNQLDLSMKSDLNYSLRDVGIVGTGDEGGWFSGWVGDMAPGSTLQCKLDTSTADTLWRKEWDLTPALSFPNFLRADETFWTDKDLGQELYLGPMLNQIIRGYPFGKGEFIALGWTDQPLGALKISPAAKQNKERTVVLLHLRAANLRPARPDLKIFPKVNDEEEL